MPKILRAVFSFILMSLAIVSQAQTWEVYDSNLQLQSRVLYDHIELLSETVKIGHRDGELFLLSRDLKPAVPLEAESVYQYLAPWIIVKSGEKLGAYHEYGQKNLEPIYDEIQTYYNLLLARKGSRYFIFERGSGKLTDLGELEEAKLTHTGMLVTKKNGNYYLPFSKSPEKSYRNLEENESDFLLAQEDTGFGLINRAGDYILSPVLDNLEHTEGNFYYGYDDKQYLLIEGTEKSGEIRYNSFHEITRNGDLMLEYIHGKLRRIMGTGGILLDTVGLEKVTLLEPATYDVLLRDGKRGLYSREGWLVEPKSNVERYINSVGNLTTAISTQKSGLLSTSGNWLIQPNFEQLEILSSDRISFKSAGMFGLLDSSGQLISSAQWTAIKPFQSQITIAERDQMKFLLDKDGKVLTEEGFDEIYLLEGGKFIIGKDGKVGLLDSKAQQLLPLDFDQIENHGDRFFIVSKDQKQGLSDAKGELVVPLAYEEILIDLENDQILMKDKYEPVVITEPEGKKNRKKKGA
ncbi:hypothetical protein [Algoriphagus namhaensis]